MSVHLYGSNPRSRGPVRHKRRGTGMLVAFALFAVAAVGGSFMWYYGNETVQTCTVEDKDRTRDSEGNSDMRIYTDQCGVLRVQDTILRGIFNSADIYNDLDVGQTYEISTVGYRIPVLSLFPTVIEVAPSN